MSAKIAAVNQTRSEPESTDRAITVSVIDVQPNGVPPPPSYEQAIHTQSEIERNRIQEQQRALEELVQEQNRLDRSRLEERTRTEERPIQQQPQTESTAQTTIITAPSTPIIQPQPTQFIQHLYAVPPHVGPTAANVTCPSCHEAIKTRVEYVTTTKTHIGALLCCAVCWPCAFCPYFMKDCRDAMHYCPSCGAYIGVHSP